MADNTPKGKVQGISQAWANPKARKGMILGGGILAVVGAVTLMMAGGGEKKSDTPTAAVKVAGVPVGKDDPTAANPAIYRNKVATADKERSEKEAANPTAAVLPRLSGLAEPSKEVAPAPVEGPKPLETKPQPRQQTTGNAPRGTARAAGMASDPNAAMRQTPEYKASAKILADSLNQGGDGAFKVLMAPASREGNGAGGAGTTASGANRPNIAQQMLELQQQKPMFRAGDALFATMDVAVNTDYSGPVVATVRQGPYAGARFIGTKALERDGLVIRFNMMSPPDGGAGISVNAYAITTGDVKNYGLTSIPGETDHHIFERYIIPAAVAFASTYGLTAGQKGSTVVSSPSSTTTSTEGLTSKDRAAIAFGSAMSPVLADVSRNSRRPITVSLVAGTEVGILFASDVMTRETQAAMAALSAQQGAVAGPGQTTQVRYQQGFNGPVSSQDQFTVQQQPVQAPATATPSFAPVMPGQVPSYQNPYQTPTTFNRPVTQPAY